VFSKQRPRCRSCFVIAPKNELVSPNDPTIPVEQVAAVFDGSLCSQGSTSSRNNSFLVYNHDYFNPAKASLANTASSVEEFFEVLLRASHTRPLRADAIQRHEHAGQLRSRHPLRRHRRVKGADFAQRVPSFIHCSAQSDFAIAGTKTGSRTASVQLRHRDQTRSSSVIRIEGPIG